MRLIPASTLLLALALFAAPAHAAVDVPLPPGTTAVAAGAAAAPAAGDEGPVAVPQPADKAVRYYRSGIALWLFGTVWGVAVPLVYLFSGLSARIRTLAQRLGRRW